MEEQNEFQIELMDETFDVTSDNDVSSIATCTCDAADQQAVT